MSELLRVAAEVGAQLPDGLMAPLLAAVRSLDRPSPEALSRVRGRHPSPGYRSAAGHVFEAWTDEPVSGPELAGMLAGSRRAAVMLREEQSLDIVWTGPANGVLPVRSTREVLIQLIQEATTSVVLLSFAAYKSDVVLSELEAALVRGVKVWIIIETKTDAPAAFGQLGGRAEVYSWPMELRPGVGQKVASLHAKGVIADDRRAFITSANLTAAAIESNIELGVLIAGGDLPKTLGHQIRELIRAGVLARIDR